MTKTKTKGYTFRRFINDIHLWMGVGSSLILFLVCLSGTIYTFKKEIEQALEPEKFYIKDILPQRKHFKTLIAFTEKETGGRVTRISYHDDLHKPYELQVSMKEEDKRGETYYVNQYTKQILGNGKGPGSDFFMFFFKMHRWLLLDQEVGRPIVGSSTIIFILLTISGLILWLPKKIKGINSFGKGLTIKFSANWKRINHDLHNALGFYSFALILIMAVTGLNWSFEWYKDGMSNLLGAKVFAGRDEEPLQSKKKGAPLPLAEVMRKGDSIFAYRGKTSITLAQDAEAAVEFRKQDAGSFNREATDRVIMDQYSGKVLKKEVFQEKSGREKIAAQIKAIHTGEIYGTFSKALYFIACLMATTLPVTGIFIWLNKMKKPDRKRP